MKTISSKSQPNRPGGVSAMSGERIVPIQMVTVIKLCPACGADMEYTGQTNLCAPPTYVHICTVERCRTKRSFPAKYPREERRPV